MYRVPRPDGTSPHRNGVIARALGIGPRRGAPHGAAQLLREPNRRHSMEASLPNLEDVSHAHAEATRRRSFPSALALRHRPLNGLLWSSSPTEEEPVALNGANSQHRSKWGANAAANQDVRQWALVDGMALFGVREDYYSTLVASACPLYPGEGEDWAFFYGYALDMSDDSLLSLNKLGEVVLIEDLYACRWSPQLGPQLFWHCAQAPITCVALTRLGFCITGDKQGYICLIDMARSEPCMLLRQQLGEIVGEFAGAVPGYLGRTAAHHATHLLWSDKVPAAHHDGLSRCGYRVEFFVGTNYGMVYKLSASTSKGFICDTGIAPHLQHAEPIISMALDYNQDVLAVAGVDCVVSVWTHFTYEGAQTTLHPEYRFRQRSAVRGIAFCPGLDQVLALGGGKKDRVLRMYDIEDRKLICEVAMPAQIVGVVWVSRWEVFVALGHSRVGSYSGLGKVYNLATGKIVCNIPGNGHALSTVKTHRGFAVYTSEQALLEFSWTPEAAPQASAAALASLKVMYPPTALR